jgi:hypothetical protein
MNWIEKFLRRTKEGESDQQRVPQNEKQESAQRKAFDVMFDEGLTYGEAIAKVTNGANLVDGKQTSELAGSRKHDIDAMKKCCDAEIETYRKTGNVPAPYYFWRVAVLSRKQKDYAQEVKYCELYLDLLSKCYERDDMPLETALKERQLSATDSSIYERLPKARELLAKSQT